MSFPRAKTCAFSPPPLMKYLNPANSYQLGSTNAKGDSLGYSI